MLLDKYLSFLQTVKRERRLVVYDTHSHSLDVLRLAEHSNDADLGCFAKCVNPSILEKLDYSSLSLYVLQYLFAHQPNYISRIIKHKFSSNTLNEFYAEYVHTGIDCVVSVPVSQSMVLPDVQPIRGVRKLRLGSIDPVRTPLAQIMSTIDEQVANDKIVGIKLHPNIQGFYPYPERNNSAVAEALRETYRGIEKHNLYLLIHGGISYVHATDGESYVKRDLARLDYFFNIDQNHSFIFSEYAFRVVIAHMGLYNIINAKLDLLINIAKQYDRIYFDTAGVSTKLIVQFIKAVGSARVVFGSDAPYFSPRYAVGRLIKEICQVLPLNQQKEVIANVFSCSYESVLKKNK